MPRHELFPMANMALGGKLPDMLRAFRCEGMTHQAIADKLAAEYGIAVSAEMVRQWVRDFATPTEVAS